MSLAINQKELLYLLSINKELSHDELSKKLGCSRHSLNIIQESLQSDYSDIFKIITSKKTLKLEVEKGKEVEFEEILHHRLLVKSTLNSFHKRQALIIEKLLFSSQYILADDLADELFISRRTVSRDLTKIKKLAEKYKIRIESKAGVGLKLIGKEFDKRLLYLYEVMNLSEIENEFPSELSELCKQITESRCLSFEGNQLLCKSIQITLLRQYHPLEMNDFSDFVETKTDSNVSSLYLALEYYLGRKLSSAEKSFATFPLHLGLTPQRIRNEQVNKLTQRILVAVEQEFGLEFDNEETAELLNSHLIYLINRSRMHWKFVEISLRNQIVKNAFSVIVASFFVEQLEKSMKIKVDSTEIVLLSTWFELLLARKSKPLIRKVAIITQGGFSFNSLVKKEVSDFFNSNVEIVFFDYLSRPSYQELNENYDLVFTDNLIFSKESLQPFVSLVAITKENQQEREQMEGRVLAQHIGRICDLSIVTFDFSKSYEENLGLLLDWTLREKVFDLDFVKGLSAKEINRISLSSEGCAFPHFTYQAGEKITLILSNDNELGLESNHQVAVKDFILIAVPTSLNDEEQDLLIKIFNNTFQADKGTIYERLGIKYFTGRIKQICLQ